MKIEYVVIIQCELAHRKCSGFACTNSFYEKKDLFENYENVEYLSFNCGGCCGKSVSAKLSHFIKKLKIKKNIEKENIVVHLSSCMTTDNHHYDRCPHLDYIKSIVKKRGIENLVEGTYISKGSKKKRELGLYNEY